jgi:organic radical activating enzyme
LGATGKVAEVFRSWQGEGLLVGQRQVFVRLAGCAVGCRYCDTEWAFETPVDVAVPGGGARMANPLSVQQVTELVEAADPGGRAPVSLTGGEPLEQPDFSAELVAALVDRDVMLETAGLEAEALARLAPHVRWIACDVKLPSATGLPDVLQRHEVVLASGALGDTETFFKLVVDGDTSRAEVSAAAALLARYAPDRPVFLQPVTPMGGSPRLPRESLDDLADALLELGLDVRVIPQVHKTLGVR